MMTEIHTANGTYSTDRPGLKLSDPRFMDDSNCCGISGDDSSYIIPRVLLGIAALVMWALAVSYAATSPKDNIRKEEPKQEITATQPISFLQQRLMLISLRKMYFYYLPTAERQYSKFKLDELDNQLYKIEPLPQNQQIFDELSRINKN